MLSLTGEDFTAEQVESLMQDAGVAAHVLASGKDLYEDPQLKHYGYFVDFDYPPVGKIHIEQFACPYPKIPFKGLRPCMLGEHNNYVLKKFAGLSDDEIADLIAEGVITTDADLPEAR